MKKKWIIILFAITALFGMTQLVPTKAATKMTGNWYKKVLASKKELTRLKLMMHII